MGCKKVYCGKKKIVASLSRNILRKYFFSIFAPKAINVEISFSKILKCCWYFMPYVQKVSPPIIDSSKSERKKFLIDIVAFFAQHMCCQPHFEYISLFLSFEWYICRPEQHCKALKQKLIWRGTDYWHHFRVIWSQYPYRIHPLCSRRWPICYILRKFHSSSKCSCEQPKHDMGHW